MSSPHPRGGSRQGLRGALGRADVGSKLIPVGLRQVLPHLLVPGLLQVVGGGVLQVGLHLGGGEGKGSRVSWDQGRRGQAKQTLPSAPPQARVAATGNGQGC